MKFRFYVGVDVSKLTLDVALIDSLHSEAIVNTQVSNDRRGIEQLNRWLKDKEGFELSQVLFCMEHTGLYNYPLLHFLTTNQLAVWVENPTHIQRMIGLKRGKNDKVDAMRIAQYAYKNSEQMRLWQPPREAVEKIRHLITELFC